MKHDATDVQNVKIIHSTAADILAALEYFSRREIQLSESAKIHKLHFGSVPGIWLHRIEIYQKCQERMAQRYCNLISKLFNNDF